MNWQNIDPDLVSLLVGSFVLWLILVGPRLWLKGRKARQVLAASLDHPIRPSEETSLNAWMSIPDGRLGAISEELNQSATGTAIDRTEPHTLACPRDSTTLSMQLVGPARFYGCATCGGMWVSDPELQTFLASPAVSLDFISLTIPAGTQIASARSSNAVRCLCNGAPLMRTTWHLGARVDVCPQCRAIWLDGGELLTIKANVPRSQDDMFVTTLLRTLRH